MKPVKLPIEDVLDLHTFQPKEIPYLLEDYFYECIQSNIFSVRIIHGKGTGRLKMRVQELLRKNPMVKSFKDAPSESGSWGAAIVELKKEPVYPEP